MFNANRQTVVIQGLGFVGLAVAGVVSTTLGTDDLPKYNVIGIDLPSETTKINDINSGKCPIKSPDKDLERSIAKGVKEYKNLYATFDEKAFKYGDIIIIDIPLDITNRFEYSPDKLELTIQPFIEGLKTIARNMRPEALIILESTVPVGMTEKVVIPTLISGLKTRNIKKSPKVAHAYERVTPGKNYIKSIRCLDRVCSANSSIALDEAKLFLDSILQKKARAATLLNTSSTELAKLLENSYRATNIAFIHEWALAAEEIGINLFDVIENIKERKGTHDNIRLPGFGVGGYCLTKDSLLAQWGLTNFYNLDVTLPLTLKSIMVNNHMPLHTIKLLEKLFDEPCKGKRITILGAAYLPNVPDSRNSPTEVLAKELYSIGNQIMIHDPICDFNADFTHWNCTNNLEEALYDPDAVVFATKHSEYERFDWISKFTNLNSKPCIVDGQDVINDKLASSLHKIGVKLCGYGKGHWNQFNYQHEN